MDLGISHIGLSQADEQRLKAILGIAVTNGVLEHRWHMSEMDKAHLVVVAAGSADGLALLAANRESRRRFFAVLAGESDDIPKGCVRLQWPIRLENVLAILKMIETKTAKMQPSPEASKVGGDSENHIVRLASLLRDSEGTSQSVTWLIKGMTRHPLYIVPAQKAFYYGDSLASLRGVNIGTKLEFVPVPVEELPDRHTRKPVVMLQWLIGNLCGQFGLLPWIKPDSTFRLKRFPEFQILHHTPQHRRLSATLTRPMKGVNSIAKFSDIDEATVTGFVNAVSLCGYLSSADGKSLPPARASGKKRPRRALFQSFRKALGIVNADA